MTIKPGALRFNTDSMKLEIFRGSANYEGSASMAGIGTLAAGQWEEIQATSPEVQTGGTRGMFVGGWNGSPMNTIDYVNIDSTGNAIDFGDLTMARSESGGFASRTRGFAAGAPVPGSNNTIDYWTISSTGNAQDFGDLLSATSNSQSFAGFANQTRGIFAGAYTSGLSKLPTLQYITTASLGNTVDFGDLSDNISGCGSGIASKTRGFRHGGRTSSNTNTIEYVEMATLGNAANFGDLTFSDHSKTGASSATRGLSFGGQTSDATIDYITMATQGNAQEFGEMNLANRYIASSGSSKTRAVVGGGNFPSTSTSIDYVQIASTGNAIDFGNLSTGRSLMVTGCFSNGHGGL
jgi:hypothetical protein